MLSVALAMRFLLEISIVVLVAVAGWRQPFRDHFASLFPHFGIAPSRFARQTQQAQQGPPTPTRVDATAWNGSEASARARAPVRTAPWMWERSALDQKPATGRSDKH